MLYEWNKFIFEQIMVLFLFFLITKQNNACGTPCLLKIDVTSWPKMWPHSVAIYMFWFDNMLLKCVDTIYSSYRPVRMCI